MGYFRYSVAVYIDGERVDKEEILIDFGRLTWDPPGGYISGYYLYVAEAVGDPYEVLPYEDPSDYDFDSGSVTQEQLKSLYDNSLLADGKSYYIAASSYVYSYPENLVSSLTAPLTFSYEVALEEP
jgi:hypothetical protein